MVLRIDDLMDEDVDIESKGKSVLRSLRIELSDGVGRCSPKKATHSWPLMTPRFLNRTKECISVRRVSVDR